MLIWEMNRIYQLPLFQSMSYSGQDHVWCGVNRHGLERLDRLEGVIEFYFDPKHSHSVLKVELDSPIGDFDAPSTP